MTDLAFGWSKMTAVELSRRIELPQFVLRGTVLLISDLFNTRNPRLEKIKLHENLWHRNFVPITANLSHVYSISIEHVVVKFWYRSKISTEKRKLHLYWGEVHSPARNGILYHSGSSKWTKQRAIKTFKLVLWCVSLISVLCTLYTDCHSKLGLLLDFNRRSAGAHIARHNYCTDYNFTTGFDLVFAAKSELHQSHWLVDVALHRKTCQNRRKFRHLPTHLHHMHMIK